MPLPVFQLCCIAIVVLTLAVMARAHALRDLLTTYAALALAGFIGEETCVRIYAFYGYADAWSARIDRVPALVALIWPLVVLSARDVVAALWPRADRAAPALVGALVAFDASLVEVVAVRAGLWHWAEPGHLGVPLIGILGWGYFAAGVDAALRWGGRRGALLAVALGPLVAHALIQLTWWGLFRWTLRGNFGDTSVAGVALLGVAAMAYATALRRAGRGLPIGVAAPRMVAAWLFLALLLATDRTHAPLWVHTAAVAVPYLTATTWGARRLAPS